VLRIEGTVVVVVPQASVPNNAEAVQVPSPRRRNPLNYTDGPTCPVTGEPAMVDVKRAECATLVCWPGMRKPTKGRKYQ
jgi:hypothetical protein